MEKLRVGKIPYANLFPIFYTLETAFDCSSYEFVEGVPSRVNRMLREGAVDISPSSSIEYLRDAASYRVVEGHSISSRGPVGSVFLFSERPPGELDGATIAVTAQSETSVALLRIILERFHGVRSTFIVSEAPEDAGAAAFLLIGDDALKYAKGQGARGREAEHPCPLPPAPCPVAYDLGELWYRHTGLPFVFALWIVRPGIGEKGPALDAFLKDLDAAKERALRALPEIARHSPLRAFMSEGEILDYWSKLDYELTAEHRKGLALFERYLKELSLVP